ncbi:REST corepressor 3-like [Eleutherodactylus coqui]|uniref:REST corepressor 3-like n=1 Tax=Eleutherodactylus coqui TaxID=57060 RepID=UPI0034620C4C
MTSQQDVAQQRPSFTAIHCPADRHCYLPEEKMLRLPELGETSEEPQSVLLWSPDHNIPDETLDEYINVAKDTYGYNEEQALGLLLHHGYNIEEAVADMPNFMPVKKIWTEDEKKKFEFGFKSYGKQFRLIQRMLPQKSIPDVVEFYYKWKKTRPDRKRPARSDDLDETPEKRLKQEVSSEGWVPPGGAAPQGSARVIINGIIVKSGSYNNSTTKLGETSEEPQSVLLWSPDHNIPDDTLDEYINVAKDNYGYNEEQALGLLLHHGYNIEEAVADMPNFMPVKKIWTEEEIKKFEFGFKSYGKQFRLIQRMLPQKSIPDVVEFYYKWKKTRPNRKRPARSDDLDETPEKRLKQEDLEIYTTVPEEPKPPKKKRAARKSTKKNAKKTDKTAETTINESCQPNQDIT